MNERILVTGANGFVGTAVCRTGSAQGRRMRGAVRDGGKVSPAADTVVVGDIDGATDWRKALDGVQTVIHCAARVHILKETADDPLREFRCVNVDGTRRLAESMITSGAKRLVFVSSIGVNGYSGRFDENSPPNPVIPYAISKWEAEQMLIQFSRDTGLEVVIVRPPLIYGKSAPGNFARLVRLVELGLPMPLGSVNNARTLVGVNNLAPFLLTCAEHPAAAGETFLIGDDETTSTPELVRLIAQSLGKRALLVPFPVGVMRAAAKATGRGVTVDQLVGTLTVDSAKARRLLGWRAPHTLHDGVKDALQ